MFQNAFVLVAADAFDKLVRRILGYKLFGTITHATALLQMGRDMREGGEGKIAPSPATGYDSYHLLAP
jgi:hypothetical protein